jgi:transposase
MPGKKYSDDFKKEAVRLLESTGKPKTTIEKELGISHGLLGRWQKRFQINPVTGKLELSEVEQLKAEL